MNEFEPVDLSPLDPERDPERWAMLMSATRVRVAEAVLRRSREADPFTLVSRWARPILAAAAAILVLLGTATMVITPAGRQAPTSPASGLVHLTKTSVLRGQTPTGAELIAAMRLGATR